MVHSSSRMSRKLSWSSSFCSGLSQDPEISSRCEDSVGYYSYLSNDEEEESSAMEQPPKICAQYGESFTLKSNNDMFGSMCSVLSSSEGCYCSASSSVAEDELSRKNFLDDDDEGSIRGYHLPVALTPTKVNASQEHRTRPLDWNGPGLSGTMSSDSVDEEEETASSIDDSAYIEESSPCDRWHDKSLKSSSSIMCPTRRMSAGNDWKYLRRLSGNIAKR
eukprot:scaffold5048_cov121-Cylindrotheca_fusiformis.AAC.19